MLISNSKLLYILLVLILFSSCNLNSEGDKQEKIETFVAAKKLVPGLWVASENLGQGFYEYSVLEFKENGILHFSRGADLAQAKDLLRTSQMNGNWKLADDPEFLSMLINEKKFVVLFDLESFGVDGLRVEIRPNGLIMGRNSELDDKTKENMGLYTFGGKIFHKE